MFFLPLTTSWMSRKYSNLRWINRPHYAFAEDLKSSAKDYNLKNKRKQQINFIEINHLLFRLLHLNLCNFYSPVVVKNNYQWLSRVVGSRNKHIHDRYIVNAFWSLPYMQISPFFQWIIVEVSCVWVAKYGFDISFSCVILNNDLLDWFLSNSPSFSFPVFTAVQPVKRQKLRSLKSHNLIFHSTTYEFWLKIST